MERENNLREYRTESDEMPKFGAGSEYGRDLKVFLTEFQLEEGTFLRALGSPQVR